MQTTRGSSLERTGSCVGWTMRVCVCVCVCVMLRVGEPSRCAYIPQCPPYNEPDNGKIDQSRTRTGGAEGPPWGPPCSCLPRPIFANETGFGKLAKCAIYGVI